MSEPSAVEQAMKRYEEAVRDLAELPPYGPELTADDLAHEVEAARRALLQAVGDETQQELHEIDLILNRRDALSDFRTRADKILAILRIAQANDPRAELAKVLAQITALTEANERLKAQQQKDHGARAPVRSPAGSADAGTEALPNKEMKDRVAGYFAVEDGPAPMLEPTFDESGDYPSNETLDAIRRWPLSCLNDGFDFIMRAWHWPEFGASNTLKPHEVEAVHDDGTGKYLRLATGGWSGNEEIISAIEDNFWMRTRWELSSSGGLRIYRYFDEPIGSGNHASQEHAVATNRSAAQKTSSISPPETQTKKET